MSEGESVREICADLKDFGCPSAATFHARVLDDKEFSERYARARILQAEAWADKIYAEATRPQIGEKTKTLPDGGVEVTTGDNVDRSRLAVDALKWTLSKLHPKKYGEKTQTEITGTDGGPLTVSWLPQPPK
jgi:hypothetical protein